MQTLLIGINSKYIHPAMGVIQIYTNSEFPCTLKEFTIKDTKENIINYIKNETFNILAFSVYIWNISLIKEIIEELEFIDTILLGGPEASYRPNDFLKYKNVKFIIKDEGEEAFNKLIYELMHEKNFLNVPNLYYRINDRFEFTYLKKPNINKIKFDYSLIKDFKNRIVYLEASRGCPFKCSYCLASLEKNVRYIDIKKVKENILYCLENKAKVIKFLDRSFNINPKQMLEIIEFLKEHDNNYTIYQFEIVGDILNEEVINSLKTIRKGLIRFEIGIQSLNETVTKAVRRKQNMEKLIRNIKEIKENIVIHLDLIAGLPYEDKLSFIDTFNKTFLLFPDELQLGFLKELQGTEISLTKEIHNYKFNSNPPYEIIENKYITKEELEEIRLVEAGVEKFYNSKNFPRLMDYLFKKLNLNPYFTFLKIIKDLNLEKLNSYQFDELTKHLYESLKVLVPDQDYLLFIIKQDYLSKFNLKPKIFWNIDINKDEKKQIFEKAHKLYNLNIDYLYRYAHIEKYNDVYYLITYKPNKFEYFINKQA